jgi:thiamine biosynthesis lipoprotein ApbE
VSAELFEVLNLFDEWQTRTGGALSASAGTGVALWQKAEGDQTVPTKEELRRAAERMNQQHWTLDPLAHTATHLSAEPLLLNSFVKSYIIDKVASKMMAIPGVMGCVVNIGGDMVISGDLSERVSISDPKADAENDKPLSILNVGNHAIATSGNYRRGYTIGNQWYGHILDARTAVPASDVISATVVAPGATDAGALATAFSILAPEESTALANVASGVSYQIIMRSGERIESEGWRTLEIRDAVPYNTQVTTNGLVEMTIELELARFEGRFRRPFVAVWIEDGKKESVRTLALWYNKPRWLPDLKRWYSKNRENLYNAESSVSSISSATRSPGRYTLKWDGLSDDDRPVSNGKYTLYIEAAREHGTYQMLRQDFDWNGKAKHITLQGGVEITAASIDCHTLTDKPK